MNDIEIGAVVRVHGEGGTHDIGKVVWVEPATMDPVAMKRRRFWYIEFPELNPTLKGEVKRRYIKAPVEASVVIARKRVDEGKLSFVPFQYPPEYFLDDEELQKSLSKAGLIRKSRRKLPVWKAKRDSLYELIRPLIGDAGKSRRQASDSCGIQERLIEQGRATVELAKRASQLGHKNADLVTFAFRKYLLNGSTKNALLPNFFHCGKPGTEKYCKTKTGAPKAPGKPVGYIQKESDRKKLRLGWKTHKKHGVSDEDAYVATMKDHYAESIVWESPTKAVVKLLPKHMRPTKAEFRFHGPKGHPELASERIKLGENKFNRTERGLVGTTRDRIYAIGQLGVIDATSEDQRPVSRASKLLRLPTSWRTMIVDAGINYIFGVHRGFEKGGTIPGLLAMLHASEDKVEWASRHLGRVLEPGEWHSIVFKRVRGDNGDLKSETGIATLASAEIGLEMTRSYAAEHKIVETTHKIIHRTADHKVAASTQGQALERGEREDEPCVNMMESWPGVLDAILRHNNEDPVPELLTLEMRQAGVGATRREILEYMIANGYVASAPYELSLFRAQCLPKLTGTIKGDGIHLHDPRYTNKGDGIHLHDPRHPKKKRYVPHLVYWAPWLHETGLTVKGGKSPIPVAVHLDPSFPSELWINIGGLKSLPLRHHDPEMNEVTLADWLYITDNDDLIEFLNRGDRESSDASRLASQAAVNSEALKAKRQEEAVQGKRAPRNANSANKRKNLLAEQEAAQLEKLGLAPPMDEDGSSDASDLNFSGIDLGFDQLADESSENLMASLRKEIANAG